MIVLDKRPLTRVTQIFADYGRMHLGFCAAPCEVAALVDLADWVEIIPLPGRSRQRL
ncbi:hypothetical protein [Acrocarpospora sp. B8E8]|uniref:hypothetical protein n=1 Tax=Acrocarpospora sp. B8E8 TaxID=3153572 RepID=UPI00325DCC31